MTTTSTGDLLQGALDLHRSGAVAEAAARYAEVLQADPANADANYYLALIDCQSGRFEDGIARARQSLAADPRHVRAHVLLGRALSALGRRDEALQSLDAAIGLAPGLAEAHSHRADALSALGRHAEAIDSYDRALAVAPQSVEDRFNRGLALTAAGRLDDALSSFDRVIAAKPDYAQAWLGRGRLCLRLKRSAEALSAVDKALALDSGLADAWLMRGYLLIDAKRRDEALAAFDRVVEFKPDSAEAWIGRGDALRELKRDQDALGAYDRATTLEPDCAEAWIGRGNALHGLGRFSDASAAFDRALTLKPDLAKAWTGRGTVSYEQRNYEEALTAYDRAIALAPDIAEAWFGRGTTLADLDQNAAALAAIDQGLELRGDIAEGWLARGAVLHNQNRFDDALAAYDRALALDPNLANAWYARGVTLFAHSRLDDALASYDKALSIKPDLAGALSGKIFALDFASNAGFAEQQQARNEWRCLIEASLVGSPAIRHTNDRDPARRIKIGYVSSDFRIHSAAYSFRPVLLNHDKSMVDVTCYSCSHIRDTMTQDFQGAADCWRDVSQFSDEALCEQIVSDRIDILVDLSGHSAGNRLSVFARKPAPVQVSAWGHAAGTGLPAVDYLFADPVVCPPSAHPLFAEKIFDLPCCITMEALAGVAPSAELPSLASGHLTFAAFNRANKVTDEAIALWAKILHAVPQSRILLKHSGFDAASVRDNCLGKFAALGIAGERIAFRGGTSRREHLAAFSEVDISLDPFPMNGGISTWESLQMGVPVIAKLGNSLASRVGGAIVSSIGLNDWVSETAEGYLAIAVKFASMPERLAELRRKLPELMMQSAAGSSVTYTRAVEAAYRKMWTDYCRGTA